MIRSRVRARGGIIQWFLSSAYKADSVSPSLILDFANNRYAANSSAKNFSDILTFTRGSTGTYFDSSGVMQTAAADVPRFDHDPATGVAKGLLVEGARTNIALYSADLVTTGSYWVRGSGGPVYTDGQTGPLYGSTCLLAEGISGIGVSLTGTTVYTQNTTVTAGNTYTASIYLKLKNTTANQVQLRVRTNGSSTSFYEVISGLSTEYFTRCSITFTVPAGDTSANFVIGTVTGSVDLYVACAQLEAGSFPSSYIPTSGSAVTRAADIVTNTSSNTVPFASWYNQVEGAVVVKFDTIATTSGSFPRLVAIDNNTTTELISLQQRNTSVGIKFEVVDGGAGQANINITDDLSTSSNVAAAFKVNDFALSLDGSLPSTDTSGTMPTPTRMTVGYGQGGINMFGHIREILYYNQRITNSELQRITT